MKKIIVSIIALCALTAVLISSPERDDCTAYWVDVNIESVTENGVWWTFEHQCDSGHHYVWGHYFIDFYVPGWGWLGHYDEKYVVIPGKFHVWSERLPGATKCAIYGEGACSGGGTDADFQFYP